MVLVVTFRLAEQCYALPLEAVLQVVRLPELSHIAGSPPTVCGLLNLRGQFLPVLDGRALIGAEAAQTLDSCLLILAHDSQPALALLADEAESVRVFPPGGLASVGHSATIIAGILHDSGESAILLDPMALHNIAGGAERCS